MRVYPFGVYLREFIHKNVAVNRGRNYEFGAGDSDSSIITMSPPPMSSLRKTNIRNVWMRPYIATRCMYIYFKNCGNRNKHFLRMPPHLFDNPLTYWTMVALHDRRKNMQCIMPPYLFVAKHCKTVGQNRKTC